MLPSSIQSKKKSGSIKLSSRQLTHHQLVSMFQPFQEISQHQQTQLQIQRAPGWWRHWDLWCQTQESHPRTQWCQSLAVRRERNSLSTCSRAMSSSTRNVPPSPRRLEGTSFMKKFILIISTSLLADNSSKYLQALKAHKKENFLALILNFVLFHCY